MADSGRKYSRLALFCLLVSVAWFSMAILVASSLFWYPWRDPQGWDKLIVFVILFWGSIITALICSVAGLISLFRVQMSEGRIAGRSIAIAGMGLAGLLVGIMVWLLWG